MESTRESPALLSEGAARSGYKLLAKSPKTPRVSRALSPEAELVSLCWLHAELVLTSLDVRAYGIQVTGGCGALWCTGLRLLPVCLVANRVCERCLLHIRLERGCVWYGRLVFRLSAKVRAKCIIPCLERLLKLTRHRWELRGPSKSRSKCVLALYQIVLGPYGILKCDEFVRP